MKLPAILTSKKSQSAVAGVWLVLSQDPVPGSKMANETLMGIVGIIVAYIIAQGWADSGKEKAKIEAVVK